MTLQEKEQAKQERDDAVRKVQNNLTAEASRMLATQATTNEGVAAAMVHSAIQTGHEMGAAHANELAQVREASGAQCQLLKVQLELVQEKMQKLEADKDSP